VFEGAGEDEGFSGEFLALDFAFLSGGADSSGLQLLISLAGGGLAEEFDDGFADLRAHLGDFFQILGFGVRQSSSEPKFSASNWAVRSPTKRIPSA